MVDGVLRVRVAAPPIEGAANDALRRLVARELDVPTGAVSLVGGKTARLKRVAVDSVEPAYVAARWPGLAV